MALQVPASSSITSHRVNFEIQSPGSIGEKPEVPGSTGVQTRLAGEVGFSV